ncbi:MAG: radical SAM protein [Elusimicrobia bacterium]|nr:radical SAM protein [Elusimicrobiota bacterium]
MIRRLEMHLTYGCVQGCVFCSESSRLARFRGAHLRAAEVARVLAVKRRQGCDHLTLTGGEPTLHPGLPAVLAAARRLGFKTYVTSNGARLAEAGYARLVLPLIDELCLSVHGDDAELHDSLTRCSGSFGRLRRALAAARCRRKLFLLTNTVVTRRNWARLEAVLRFILARPGVRHCLLSQVAPEGRGAQDYGRQAVPFSWWRRKLPALARLAERRGAVLRVFGLPLCALGKRQDCSNDLYFSPRVTVERGGAGLRETVSLRPTRRRVQPPLCLRCALRQDCGGVFRRHLAEFGTAGLRPMRP